MRFKRVGVFVLVVGMILSQSIAAYAGPLDGLKKTVNKAGDLTKKVAKETEKVGKKVANQAEKVGKKTVDQAGDLTKKVAKEAEKVGKKVVKEANKVGKKVAKDVSKHVKKILKDNPELNELDLLPVLTIDLDTMKNVQTCDTGVYTYGENVKDKKLPFEAEEELKQALMKIGLTKYWANHVINEAAQASGDMNIGEYIAGMLPYSRLYGDKVADAVNKVLKNHALIDIDPYVDGVVPADDVEGMNLTYTVDGSKVDLNGNQLVIITGVTYGKRDDFTISVKSGEEEFPTEKKALNGKEVAFVAEVPEIQDLQIIYKNSFKKPKDIAFEVASGIQDAINKLAPVGKPISDGARDKIADRIGNLAYQIEKTKKDKDGNVKRDKDGFEKKEYEQVSLNDVLGDGDIGVILTESIYKIPGLGAIIKPVLKATGNDDKLAGIIRTVIGQVEVKSYAKIKDGKIYIKQFDSAEEMTNQIENATTESNVNMDDYVNEPVDTNDSVNTDTPVNPGNVDGAAISVVDLGDVQKPQMPTTVKIAYGDTVGNISLQYYGDYSMMKKIYNANKAYFSKTHNKLNVGDTLVLPSAAKFMPPVADEHTKVYTVQSGDTLAHIAKYFYGNGRMYRKIVDANVGIIKNPNRIYVGQKLAIPVK
ncbi:LysM peptidoglycan-binding domain-containing protein [Crassaminicella profunda]|uniref:LysM peptidoglycan-binding domain-containing protein n=1 Tax=Crassaminicella profunda TaxID=1286698 RepID=UPI001CA6EA6F|nr:LysM peptidoglycan-binding domain-containing protein [Crassaminicella profunda]QZY55980.1 LysM peptidoglycan-binding domain-containing protein [Crassaminicella profunda]